MQKTLNSSPFVHSLAWLDDGASNDRKPMEKSYSWAAGEAKKIAITSFDPSGLSETPIESAVLQTQLFT
jgi:hypothetical protein